jgi:hypothetical protein
MKPHSPHGSSHPKAGGEHEDALEHGMPHDRHSEGAGAANQGVGVKPSGSPNELERGDYPEPGTDTAGGGAHNHRILPPPSKEAASGGRGTMNARGATGEGGRGASGKFRGTMGDGEKGPTKYKGCVGC